MDRKQGRPRKSRRRRLPTSGGSWDDEFEPTNADWARIEIAYGFPLPDADRKELIDIVRSHLMWEPFERNAPFVDDAEEWLENVTLTAKKFFNTLIEQHEPKVREASWAAETLIEKHFRTREPPRPGEGNGLERSTSILLRHSRGYRNRM